MMSVPFDWQQLVPNYIRHISRGEIRDEALVRTKCFVQRVAESAGLPCSRLVTCDDIDERVRLQGTGVVPPAHVQAHARVSGIVQRNAVR